MIPNLELVLQMHADGEMTAQELGLNIMRKLVQTGTPEDFKALPPSIKAELDEMVRMYRETGVLYWMSSKGSEDLVPLVLEYVERFGS